MKEGYLSFNGDLTFKQCKIPKLGHLLGDNSRIHPFRLKGQWEALITTAPCGLKWSKKLAFLYGNNTSTPGLQHEPLTCALRASLEGGGTTRLGQRRPMLSPLSQITYRLFVLADMAHDVGTLCPKALDRKALDFHISVVQKRLYGGDQTEAFSCCPLKCYRK